jgi:hypothetical protein
MPDESTAMTEDDDMNERDELSYAELDDDELDESTLHHVDAIDLRSLGVVAGLFYLTAFLVLALAIVGVWLFAAALGLISQLEDFMRSIGFRGFRLVGPEVIIGFVLILAALVVFLTVMTLVAAAFYNLLGTGRRGVRIRTSPVRPDELREPGGDQESAETAAVPLATESPDGEGQSEEAPKATKGRTAAAKKAGSDGAGSRKSSAGADDPDEAPEPEAVAG